MTTLPPMAEDEQDIAKRKEEAEDQQRRLDEQVVIAQDAIAEVKKLIAARKAVSWEELYDDPRRGT